MTRKRWSRYSIEVTALLFLRPLGIAFFVLITVFPFYYMLLLSVRDISQVIESPGSIIVGFGELSTVGARSVLRRYADAWFQATRRRNQQRAGFPRRKRGLPLRSGEP